jgi:hypothetical protein
MAGCNVASAAAHPHWIMLVDWSEAIGSKTMQLFAVTLSIIVMTEEVIIASTITAITSISWLGECD